MEISIRMASVTDAEELQAIYAPYVTDTSITFAYAVPSAKEFSQAIHDTLRKYPYLVAVENNSIVGYAYASAFNKRAAYDWAVETSIYLKQDHRGSGLGKKLYLALEDVLKRQNIINLNACIAYTAVSDAHLDNTSAIFHEHLGYKKVAHFTKCGYKFSTWYDMIWMEKVIGEHTANPKPIIPITMLQT
ncbi:MAG TPA: GNAT family N-acetyltransferase [Anaerovoracaceae bacterium]|nr:GNAT family N-acetyltransferase [Anaerovoracaceae bacterium]